MSTSGPSDPGGGGLLSATLPHSTFQWQVSSDVVLGLCQQGSAEPCCRPARTGALSGSSELRL